MEALTEAVLRINPAWLLGRFTFSRGGSPQLFSCLHPSAQLIRKTGKIRCCPELLAFLLDTPVSALLLALQCSLTSAEPGDGPSPGEAARLCHRTGLAREGDVLCCDWCDPASVRTCLTCGRFLGRGGSLTSSATARSSLATVTRQRWALLTPVPAANGKTEPWKTLCGSKGCLFLGLSTAIHVHDTREGELNC
ncbi:uncharacterized protein LOC112990137 [Dromaius novaehollandiae]|uniref:uncharacterized protein LOC112990137 n=1 Tax=Dromaius novaehollandiae TaxID=8790 RepID=UPI00311E6BE3